MKIGFPIIQEIGRKYLLEFPTYIKKSFDERKEAVKTIELNDKIILDFDAQGKLI